MQVLGFHPRLDAGLGVTQTPRMILLEVADGPSSRNWLREHSPTTEDN